MKIGNIIYYITKYTGIKYLVDKYHKLRGTKCDCNNRRKKLNEIKIDRWKNLIKKILKAGVTLGQNQKALYNLMSLN